MFFIFNEKKELVVKFQSRTAAKKTKEYNPMVQVLGRRNMNPLDSYHKGRWGIEADDIRTARKMLNLAVLLRDVQQLKIKSINRAAYDLRKYADIYAKSVK